MAKTVRCPECGGGEIQQPGDGARLRCAGCGAELAYRVPWLAFLLSAAAVGALIGLGSHWLLQALAPGWQGLRIFVAGGLAGLAAVVLSRRLRRLSRA